MYLSSYCSVFRTGFLTAAILLSLTFTVPAQKVDKEKLETGTKRAASATKVLTDITALPASESIPRELIERARAIAVFPNVTKTNVLFMKVMKGYGLAAVRTAEGWSTPVFYGFGVQDKGWTRVKSDSPGIVMLFLGDGALKAFEKDHVEIAGAGEGPIGESVLAETQKKINHESVLVYALTDGKLVGVSIADDSSSLSALGIDNNINKAVFGQKGRDVLWGKVPVIAVPAEITEFQKALVALTNNK